MRLDKDVNAEATAKKVRCYLDEKVPRLKRYAAISLTSPQLDPVGGSHGSFDNRNEAQALRAAEANAMLANIWRAMSYCERFQRAILLRMYQEDKGAVMIAQSIQYQSTQYYKKRKEALAAFADYYEGITGIDLHVYVDD